MAKRLTYKEKLRDPRWQRMRLEIFHRDNFQCKMCESFTEELQVHHQQYHGSNPWDADKDFMITLCRTCHEQVEEWKKVPLVLLQFQITSTYDYMRDGKMGWHMINRKRKIRGINHMIKYAYGESNQIWR